MKLKQYRKLQLLNSGVYSFGSPPLPTIDIIPEPMFNRRKFGSIGWSTKYIFNEVDLQICADVLNNFLYEDLRYLYGEIMYGGHITYKRAFKPLRRAAWA